MHVRCSVGFLAVVFVIASATSGAAQEADGGRIGLTMGYPTGIGIIVPLSERVAVRPEFTISFSSGESTSSSTTTVSTNDGWGIGGGLSGLFYLSTHDQLRTYLTPRVTYTRTRVDSGASGSANVPTETVNSSYSVAGSVGVEYRLQRRVAMFGELGYGYSRSEAVFSGVGTRTVTVTRTSGLRTGVGIIVFF